jgi:hypothetical protein
MPDATYLVAPLSGSGLVGINMYIRDEQGAFVLVKIKWFTLKCEVYIGEIVGLQHSIELVKLIFGRAIFELDSKKVVDSILSA